MYNHLLYFTYWLTNSFVFFLSSIIVPDRNVILGSWRFNNIESSIYAGFWATFLIWVWWDFAIAKKFNLENKIIAFGFFFFVNFFSIYVVSRFSRFTGFELVNYQWVFVIGFAVTFLQRIIRKVIVRRSQFL
ncbi:MAG: hypothetical protein ABIC96_04480 [Patescibacteria group bacterium]